MRFYYTYVLKSKKDGKLYTGWTEDLVKRISDHNKGLTISTKQRKPFELIYYEACLSEKGAIKREKQLKTGFGRAYIKRRLTK
ncbi:MAG: GIY-YIG nuclease family protein [Candidatus Gottesmanbacteria bacterium]